MALQIGDIIPEFTLRDQQGEEVHSDDLLGQKALVLFFYPKNFTPGCTREACEFRDKYEDFNEMGARVVGISSDNERSHKRFAVKYNLPYTLLSDDSGKVRKKFGVQGSLLGLIPGRETFLFNAEGKLIFKFNSLDASPHIRKALKFLKDQEWTEAI